MCIGVGVESMSIYWSCQRMYTCVGVETMCIGVDVKSMCVGVGDVNLCILVLVLCSGMKVS